MGDGWWQSWWQRRRRWRQARRLVRDLFDDPQRLTGTSLRPAHRGRVEIVDVQVDVQVDDGQVGQAGDGDISRIYFTILRHPRPYPFSRQFHAVVQKYCYDVPAGQVRHEQSVNLSRLKGGDGEPGGGGVGV